MPGSDAPLPEGLIAGLYKADPARPVSGFDGASAFVARGVDAAEEFLAIESPAGMAPRALALKALANQPIPGLMAPLAHGPAKLPGRRPAYYVVTPSPPGQSLLGRSLPGRSLVPPSRAWSEAALLALVLRPVAAALERLAARGVTHRAIRPDNLFQAAPDEPVVLGPAWSTPPASRQPALYEPPYVAQCRASGRGEGGIAEDIYALGVVLIVLALGREPLADEEPEAIVRRKLALGSFAAIAAEERLPGELSGLVRAMLAEDPGQRPLPAELLDPVFARGRRAPHQFARRAPEPLVVGAHEAFLPRSLAHALAETPQVGIRLLRLGVVDRWLRRSLGDPALAQAVEQVTQRRARDATEGEERADALLLMRAVAVLDPLAPLAWRGISFWPDGLGPMLAEGDAASPIAEIIETEVLAAWAACRAGREPSAALSMEARRLRALAQRGGLGGGLKRLGYFLNPLMSCRSPLIGEQIAVTIPALLTALDGSAAEPDRRRDPPMDAEIAAFILARASGGLEADLTRLAPSSEVLEKALVPLRVFAALQVSTRAGPLPRLGRWLATQAEPLLGSWKERSRRKTMQEQLSALAERGDLAAMLKVVEDPSARARDTEGLKEAERTLKGIDDELARIASGAPLRAEKARQLGQEIAAGAGLAALSLTLVMMAFG